MYEMIAIMDRPVAPEALVFVVAPDDIVMMYQTARELVSFMRRMDEQERRSASFFTIDGEELDLTRTLAGGVWLMHSGRDGSDDLSRAFRALADDDDTDAHVDPRLVANEVLEVEWESRWPRRPRWLRRLIRGQRAPTIDDRWRRGAV
ncbi:hypothetical protein [Aeromicrobium sp. Leaf350]|uniref:hypothetical protein n=1 Tax=Aeromicrobium sp. Leaf350 TaxID=2876565 RepID=UPI001E48B6F9|nr:hypothetical protein [Aeromicrobium sp. Leaf350]